LFSVDSIFGILVVLFSVDSIFGILGF
jgi:hypothetical protein